MEREKRTLKPYHGAIAFAGFLLILLVISPFVTELFNLGIYGSLFGEVMFLVLAIAMVAAFHGDFRRVFPIHKPKIVALFGTVLLWIGTLVGVMIITLILAFFFPQEVMSMSQGLGESFTSASFWVSMFLVAVIPAICEEAVFRGVLLNSLWSINNKWLVIVIIGGVFGVCHGSIWRFFPTALLGMMLTYIIIETNNILYSSFMHFINNLLPLVMMYALQSVVKVSQGVGTQDMYNTSITGIPLMSVAIYMLIGTMIPFCIYIGNYLLHKGQKGAPVRLFPEENRRTLYFLIALTGVIFVCGICLMIGSSYLQLVV